MSPVPYLTWLSRFIFWKAFATDYEKDPASTSAIWPLFPLLVSLPPISQREWGT